MFSRLMRRLIAKKKGPFRFDKYRGQLDFSAVPEGTGLYIHIPFCKSLCPYCPYNKKLYSAGLAAEYRDALFQEYSILKDSLAGRKISSIYFGGGTPTLMLEEIGKLLGRVRRELNFVGDVGIELHPREATAEKLDRLKALGINMVSLGVQTFADSTLEKLGRNHSGQEARTALAAVTAMGFDCVDVDIMFNLPDQTTEDIEGDITLAYQAGVEQLSVYPLILFPMTSLPKKIERSGFHRFSSFQEWRLLKRIGKITAGAGYQRTSVWTYGRPGIKKYTSVTRPSYIGLGAGAASQFGDTFYLNTFDVGAYIDRVKQGDLPINLVNILSRREAMAYWLFWRFYETRIDGQSFKDNFGTEIDQEFPRLLKLARLSGLLNRDGEFLNLSPLGIYLYHLVEKYYSVTYLNDTWAASQEVPWLDGLSLD